MLPSEGCCEVFSFHGNVAHTVPTRRRAGLQQETVSSLSVCALAAKVWWITEMSDGKTG